MKRIILHWTGGPYKPTPLDLRHYHFIIDGSGQVVPGRYPVSANRSPIRGSAYAAHTRRCNGDSIGVAMAAMGGAVESPFSYGRYPVTRAQVIGLTTLVRKLMADYGIPLSRSTVLSHAEVPRTLNIRQAGKWDITWLPGMARPGDPVQVGDHLRSMLAD